MYHPTLEEVRRLKEYGNLVPVCRDIQADLETPVSAYLKIARGNYSFLLESVEGGEGLARPVQDPQGFPESVLMLADTLLVFDHISHKIKVVSHAHLDGDVDTAYREATCKIDDLVNRLEQPMHSVARKNAALDESEVSSNFSRAEFEAIVSQAKEYIYAGDVIQAVLSQRLSRRTNADPFAIYRALRSINPSPYMYYLHLGDFYIAGASPELLVRVEDGIVSTHPIAGTRRRGKTAVDATAREGEH